MNKKHMSIPNDGFDTVIYNLLVYRILSGNKIKEEDLLSSLKSENVKLTEKLKGRLIDVFPELKSSIK